MSGTCWKHKDQRYVGCLLCKEDEIDDLKEQLQRTREALKEQLDKRGYAFRGRCDGVPDDIRRAFVAIGTPCDEIDKKALESIRKEIEDERNLSDL